MLAIYDGMNFIRLQLEAGGGSISQLFSFYANPKQATVWVWEGVGGNNRRRAKFPDYKSKRQKPAEDIFRSINFFRDLLHKYSSCYNISVEGYEGDDVVYTLAQFYRERCPVYIYSTDKDFRQFYGHNVDGMATPIKDYYKMPLPDKYVRLWKTLVGDQSDNIPGIPQFGPKKFEDCDKDRILDKFENGYFQLDQWDNVDVKFIAWTADLTNRQLLQTMWEVVGPILIPFDQITANMKRGTFDPVGAKAELSKLYM